tara:strand:- start:245 stop:688 length:444 start_codon:yes stop_codon:yes gene_type:complete
MKLNRRQLRRLISESINELTLVKSGVKVVDLEISDKFYLRHPELEGGEIVVDEMDEVAGALVALKSLPPPPEGPGPYTHVYSVESELREPIGSAIQYFDEGDFLYAEHYGDVSHDALVDDMDMDMDFKPLPYDTLIDDEPDSDDDYI